MSACTVSALIVSEPLPQPAKPPNLRQARLRLVKAADLDDEVTADVADAMSPDDPTASATTSWWTREELIGRIAELYGNDHSGHLTLAGSFVHQFQTAGEPVAWVTTTTDTFFPPDLAGTGVDLTSLPVVRLSDPVAATTVTDRLIRSGAFGLVVLELIGEHQIPTGILGRLVRLTRQQEASLVCLTQRPLGSMVSLRGTIHRHQEGSDGIYGVVVQKDRRRGPGYRLSYRYRAPHGVC